MDDYKSDVEFGSWLREKRTQAGLSLEDAAQKTFISLERLKALELGYSERGVTRAESVRLSEAYHVALDTLLAEASKD